MKMKKETSDRRYEKKYINKNETNDAVKNVVFFSTGPINE